MSLETLDKIRELQNKLYRKAKNGTWVESPASSSYKEIMNQAEALLRS